MSIDNREILSRDVERRMRGEKVGNCSRPDPAPDEIVPQDTKTDNDACLSHRSGEKTPRIPQDIQGMLNKNNAGKSLNMRTVHRNDTQKHLIMKRDGAEEPGEVLALQTD